MVSKYSGGCRCGNVTYTISGEPVWNMSCHCNWCQTTSGSAFRTFVSFPIDSDAYKTGYWNGTGEKVIK